MAVAGSLRDATSNPPAIEQVFASNATGILIIGTQGTGTVAGRNARYVSGPYTCMAMFRCYGRKLTMGVLPYGADLTIRVDGVAQVIPQNDSTWSDVVVFDNPTDAWHEIEQATGGVTYLEMDNLNYLTLESANPQVEYPSTVSNPIYAAYVASYIVNDGTMASVGAENYSPYTSSAGQARFRAAASLIRVLAFGNGSVIALYQDGTLLGRVQTDAATSVCRWYSLPAPAGPSEHEYTIASSNVTNGSGAPAGSIFYFNRISADGMVTSALSAKDVMVWIGDSITWGYGIVSGFLDTNFASQVSLAKNRAWVNLAIGGKTLIQALADGIVAATNAYSPAQVVVNYGHNDVVGATTDDDFRNAVYTILSGLCGGSATKIYYPGILPYTGSGAKLTTFNGYIAAIAGGAADALGRTLTAPQIAKCVFLDTSAWITPATHTTDGTHPNQTGMDLIADQLEAAIT